jgi:hypothetical protein
MMCAEQGELYMATNPMVAVGNSISSVFDLDRRTQRELVEQTNRMLVQAELTREALNAISQIFVYSKYQVSLALKATKAIEDSLAATGIPEEEYLAYHRMLEHEYLQKMATVTHKGADAISR